MRVKQTARKSTAGGIVASQPRHSTARNTSVKREPGYSSSDDSSERTSLANSSSSSRSDPLRERMSSLLETKRKSTSGPKNTVKVRPRSRPGEVVMREIQKLQKTHELLIPRSPFHRLIREITDNILNHRPADQQHQLKYQAAAIEALQEAAESYLVHFFEDSYLCTRHANRVTLFAKDMHLCRRIQANAGIF